jgi:lipoprotein-anchoring transpeptidase ErfK/SrfK
VNSLKPIILLVVLGGVAFGVYRSLSKEPQTPPPGVDASATAVPDIKLGDLNANSANVAAQRENKSAGPNTLRPENAGVAPAFNRGDASQTIIASAGPSTGADAGQATAGLRPPQGLDQLSPRNEPAAQQQAAGAATFSAAWSAIQPSLNAGQLATALKELSVWHNHPSLGAQEREMVDRLLGQLAGTVIYSREHLLAAPYQVQPGERLEDIAAKWKISPELLAKINELDPAAAVLPPGHQIKVIPGPFSAMLDVGADRLTLFLDGCYAGSFPVADVGGDVATRVGSGTPVEFTVSQKTTAPIYNSQQGEIEAGAPANPLGGHLLQLGGELAIHGTNPNASPGIKQPEAGVRMSAADIVDVYDILTVGSRVVIRK